MSQGFAFMRQKRAFLPDMQFQFIKYTINPDFAKDCFFTQLLPVKNPLYREGLCVRYLDLNSHRNCVRRT
jgi:hypothetical protein